MIENICNVFIFVENQQKAKEFWVNKLGFLVKSESSLGDGNLWLEVCPQNSQTTLVLYPKKLKENYEHVNSTITFFTKDINKTYSELSSKGVKFTKEPENMGFGIFTEFFDEDGNSFSLKQV